GYSTKNPSEKYLFDLKIYWGEERLRQRAKKYILLENVPHPKIGHIFCTRDVYTEVNDKEVQQLDNKDLTIQDVEMLETQTRIFTVKICDDRVNASRPTSRQQFRSQSEDMGLPADYYVPRNSLDVSMGETLMSIYSTNQTLIPKGSKPIKKK
uniref:Uncharacterized protein n=1 Tax=Panagrolaimus sp. JU765 TaxID=591449 RepID=A0AC34QC94_9BILA